MERIKFYVSKVLFIFIVAYLYMRVILIGIKWAIRGARSGWTKEEMGTEAEHEIEEYLNHFYKKLEAWW